MKLGIRSKLMLPTLALVIVIMTISTVILYKTSSSALKATVNDEMNQISISTVSLISSWIEKNKLDLTNWAEFDVFRNSFSDDFMGKAARKKASVQLEKWKKQYKEYELICLVDSKGNIIASSDTEIIDKINVGDRGYFQKSMEGELAMSEVIISRASGNPVFVASEPVKEKKSDKIGGVLFTVIDMKAFSDKFIRPIKVGESGYVFIVENSGKVIAHPQKEKIVKSNISETKFGEEIVKQKTGILEYSDENEIHFSAFRKVEGLNWIVVITAPEKEILSSAIKIRNIMILFSCVISLLLGTGLWVLLDRIIIKPVLRVGKFAGFLRKGNLKTKLPTGHDEIGKMGGELNAVVDELILKAKAADGIAQGDLAQKINIASEEDQLGRSLQNMVKSLNKVVVDLYSASDQVAAGASQVSDSSQSLSQGATEQASSLEEITSSMTQIGTQTKTNAENASQANQLSVSARESSDNGVQQMKEMASAMQDIDSSSKEVVKIIKTIDDIAFQTNLLALNAAVEAARAGAHGKGFAVVAQEVRTLAGRSAKAAQDTAELIENSMKQVEKGNEIANKTSEALVEINEGVTKVAKIIGEIAASSNEQAQGIAQINQGLSQIDGVTQQNTANAEETSSAAVELNSQADHVRSILSKFKVGGQEDTLQGSTLKEQEMPIPPLIPLSEPEAVYSD